MCLLAISWYRKKIPRSCRNPQARLLSVREFMHSHKKRESVIFGTLKQTGTAEQSLV
ncbi:uncharacterized protein Smp_200050 [Schistosoma mansoni]|uniref:uncharacterized protein n=1 Tax=Schistosoma mansoni TaxID=6183 RepID=UPI00022DBF62|nr:uncharacterized protein Smp_200050 [Schistosoma mansoni]|eukprot:XP_018649219.1 uncharacterized protein Smp_200050 [Schistosoma mansoni]